MRELSTSRLFWLAQLIGWLLIGNPAFALSSLARSLQTLGSLIIVGGGDTPSSVQERFIELAGSVGTAKIAVFPMASQKSDEEAAGVVSDLQKLGS